MSVFETYDETSRHFDATRVPIGAEIVLGCLARHAKPLGELVVLDAGCGTGAYSRAIVGRVGRIEAIDMSAGMLGQARAKLEAEAEAGAIPFAQGWIAESPLEAASVHAVIINRVVHHLGDTAEDGFARLREVIGDFARVLRHGGVLVINHCSQEQLSHAFWYYHLCPRGFETFRRRFVPLEMLRAIFEDAGFVNRGSFVPVDAICQGDAYFDGRGPLSKAWRDGASFWAQVSADELDRALARVPKLDPVGALEAFVADHAARPPGAGLGFCVPFAPSRRRPIYELEDMQIATPAGEMVPFREVARIVETRAAAGSHRIDQRRAIVVTADIDQAVGNSSQILADLMSAVAGLEAAQTLSELDRD